MKEISIYNLNLDTCCVLLAEIHPCVLYSMKREKTIGSLPLPSSERVRERQRQRISDKPAALILKYLNSHNDGTSLQINVSFSSEGWSWVSFIPLSSTAPNTMCIICCLNSCSVTVGCWTRSSRNKSDCLVGGWRGAGRRVSVSRLTYLEEGGTTEWHFSFSFPLPCMCTACFCIFK